MGHFHSDIYDGDLTYNQASRERKAKKLLFIIKDYLQSDTHQLTLLEVGCAEGIITKYLAKEFRKTVGIDVDQPAIERASKKYRSNNLSFISYPGSNLPFKDNSFDVLVVSQVYEHVEDSDLLMNEVYRVLKPTGCCLLGAGNRLTLIDAHYPKLPFISLLPIFLANIYVKITGQGEFYEPRLKYITGIKKMISKFKVTDYTLKVIKDPTKYHAQDVVKPNSLLSRLHIAVLKSLYWVIPNYLLVLSKRP